MGYLSLKLVCLFTDRASRIKWFPPWNLTILGAASNVIIIQQAESRGETLTFMEFMKIGMPLTLVQAGIYAVCLGVV
ncbi:hypothetical protein Mboo_0800 [Methanoregula boonei 6A8]|jgi:hypothetical protein|uniref:Uncharacterized protein n=1 Tax=Methanoregula boonei (strain DSM 21154 / JCM 14090 / 6A8) TaxID=456442 RepID=A7I6F7_METB6|nr:hypothetical protein Mboo_0800 [Methanoregula boonei 6A8]